MQPWMTRNRLEGIVAGFTFTSLGPWRQPVAPNKLDTNCMINYEYF